MVCFNICSVAAVVVAERQGSSGSNQEEVPDLLILRSMAPVPMASTAMITVVKRRSTPDNTDTSGAVTHPLPTTRI